MDAERNKFRRLREFWVMRRQLDDIQENLKAFSPENQAAHYRALKKTIRETWVRSMEKLNNPD